MLLGDDAAGSSCCLVARCSCCWVTRRGGGTECKWQAGGGLCCYHWSQGTWALAGDCWVVLRVGARCYLGSNSLLDIGNAGCVESSV
jgi:hypothetical protein